MQNSFNHSSFLLLSFHALAMTSVYRVLYTNYFISYLLKQHCRGLDIEIWLKQQYYHQVNRQCNYSRHQSKRKGASTSFCLGASFSTSALMLTCHATAVQIENVVCHVYRKNTSKKSEKKTQAK